MIREKEKVPLLGLMGDNILANGKQESNMARESISAKME
jgi:hypothetical protein